MLTVLHGDNLVGSYTHLQNLKKGFSGEIVTVNSKNLTAVSLEELVGQNALFAASKMVVIEGLPKASVIAKINQLSGSGEIVVWIDKKTTATSLKGKILEFKDSGSSANFKLADNLTAKDFKGCIREIDQLFADKTPPELIVGILARQLKLMLMVQGGQSASINSYVVQKISPHLKKWTENELKDLIFSLLKVDHQIKTGRIEARTALFNYLAKLL